MSPVAAWKFDHPHRDLAMRGYNAAGKLVRGLGWKKPLDMQQMLAAASQRIQFSDWGDDSFREPLKRLLTALESEARLTSLGRSVFKKVIGNQICNRLRIQRAATDAARPILPLKPPLFVLGLPRTGTTLLLNLLAQDPSRRPLMTHEALYPLGIGRSNGLAEARWVAWAMNRAAPGLKAVHPFEADAPEECTWLLSNTFLSPHFAIQAHIPSYVDWLMKVSSTQRETAYRYLHLQLQLIQQGDGDRAWLLKSPALLGWLDSLFNVFPESNVVCLHRDLAEVIPSACSLFSVLRGIYSDQVDAARLGPVVIEMFRIMLESSRSIARTDARILHVQYTDLVKNPMDTVRKIYAHCRTPYPADLDDRMTRFLSQQQRHKLPSHRYSLEQFGLSRSDLAPLLDVSNDPVSVAAS